MLDHELFDKLLRRPTPRIMLGFHLKKHLRVLEKIKLIFESELFKTSLNDLMLIL